MESDHSKEVDSRVSELVILPYWKEVRITVWGSAGMLTV